MSRKTSKRELSIIRSSAAEYLRFQAAPQARNMSNRRWSVSVANAEPAETDSTIVQPCKG